MSTLTSTRDTAPGEPATFVASAGGLTGLWPMTRLALRRDRVWWPAWIVLIAVQVVATAGAYESLYPTPQSRLGLGTTMGKNTSLRALYGPAFDLTSAGGFTAWRMGGFAAAVIGLMSLLAVIRHTRAEEEAGRLELLRSGVVGRHAPLAAALLVTIGANVILAVIVIVGLISENLPVAGAVALGLAFVGCGIVFAGVGAVTAQISENARPARGMAASVLGVAYLLRAVGDSSDTATWLSWLSPVGWAQQTRAFAGERWWALLIPLVVGVGLIVLAVSLEGRRDFGAGLRPSPLGPDRAGAGLSTAAALAWRLQRGSWLAWTIGIAIFAGAIGSVANGVLDIFKGNAQLEEIIQRLGGTQSLIDAFFAAILPVLATVGTIHSVQAMLRLRSEETETRVEQVLGTAVTRTRLMGSHLVHAVASPADPDDRCRALSRWCVCRVRPRREQGVAGAGRSPRAGPRDVGLHRGDHGPDRYGARAQRPGVGSPGGLWLPGSAGADSPAPRQGSADLAVRERAQVPWAPTSISCPSRY